jgi:hypothetical protein
MPTEPSTERPWYPRVARVLRQAAATCPLAGAVIPVNAREERARLARDPDATPAWRYAAFADEGRRDALLAVRDALASLGGDPLAAVLAARAEELADGSLLATLVGEPAFSEALPRRAWRDDTATQLAESWARERPSPAPRLHASAGPGATLETALRERLLALGVGWPVIVRPRMAALAATGDGFVAVAEGRTLSEEALARTVVHEIEGHVLPRIEAARAAHPLAGIGSASGALAQEGWAIVCEERAGLLGATRRHELGWRALACARMAAGEAFVAVRRALEREAGFDPELALALAERVFRGSDGRSPGQGREAAYVTYYARVRAHLADDPAAEAHYRAAEITPEACRALGSPTADFGR